MPHPLTVIIRIGATPAGFTLAPVSVLCGSRECHALPAACPAKDPPPRGCGPDLLLAPCVFGVLENPAAKPPEDWVQGDLRLGAPANHAVAAVAEPDPGIVGGRQAVPCVRPPAVNPYAARLAPVLPRILHRWRAFLCQIHCISCRMLSPSPRCLWMACKLYGDHVRDSSGD